MLILACTPVKRHLLPFVTVIHGRRERVYIGYRKVRTESPVCLCPDIPGKAVQAVGLHIDLLCKACIVQRMVHDRDDAVFHGIIRIPDCMDVRIRIPAGRKSVLVRLRKIAVCQKIAFLHFRRIAFSEDDCHRDRDDNYRDRQSQPLKP